MARPCANAWRGCDGEATGKKDECPNCLAHAGRWRKRKTGDILKRHRNLQLWDHRMLPLLPSDADERLGMSTTPPRAPRSAKVANLPIPHKSFSPPQRKRA
jgi:hypothetical protein